MILDVTGWLFRLKWYEKAEKSNPEAHRGALPRPVARFSSGAFPKMIALDWLALYAACAGIPLSQVMPM